MKKLETFEAEMKKERLAFKQKIEKMTLEYDQTKLKLETQLKAAQAAEAAARADLAKMRADFVAAIEKAAKLTAEVAIDGGNFCQFFVKFQQNLHKFLHPI